MLKYGKIMAEETTSKIYDIQIQGSEALKTLANLKLQSQELKEQQKALGKVTEENAADYYKLDSQIKATNQQAAAYQKQVTTSIKLQNSQTESLDKLRAQLSLDNAEYAKLGNAAADAGRKADLGARIAATTEELNKQEQALGNYTRQVGNYAVAGKTLQQELRQITEAMAAMHAQGLEQSAQYKDLAAKAGQMRDSMADARAAMQINSSDTKGLDTVIAGAQHAAAMYGVWKSAAAALGIENESLEKSMQAMLSVTTAISSLQQLQKNLQSSSLIYQTAANALQKIGINQTKQETKALAAKNTMLTANSVGTKLAAAATWLWNAALAANPVVLVTIALAALVTGIAALTGAFKGSSKESKEAARVMAEYKRIAQETTEVIEGLERAELRRSRENEVALAEEIAAIRERGGTAAEIAEAEYQAGQRQYEQDQSYGKAKLAQYSIEYAKAVELLAVKEAELNNWDKSYKKLVKAQEEVDELRKTTRKLYDTLETTSFNIRKAGQDAVSASQDHTKAVKQTSKEAGEAAVAAADKALQAWLSTHQQLQKIAEETYKAQNIYIGDSLQARLAYETGLFQIQQTGAMERLDAQRKAGKITAVEYANEHKLLEIQAEQFYAKQLATTNDYYKELRTTLKAQAGLSVDEQIGEATAKYTKAMADLASIPVPKRLPGMSDEDYQKALDAHAAFLYNQTELELRLTTNLNTEIAAIRKADLDARVGIIDAALELQYGDELAKFQDNEREKLRIQAEYLQQQIAQYAAAGKSTWDLEAQLRATGLAQAKLDMDKSVLQAGENAKAQYEARRAYLEAEFALVQGNADAELELMAQMQELKTTYWDEQITSIADYATKVMEVVGQITELVKQNSDAQKQKVETQYADEQQYLADKHATGLLTEAQYNAETMKLERKKEKELAKIERDEAKRAKAIQLMEAGIATALAIVRALNAPPPVSFAYAATAGAMGLLQQAAIIATPLPEAAKGAYITGPRHSGGGVAIEAEGGEVIINRKATSMFLPLLSAINEMGGGVPFTSFGADGGYAARSAMSSAPGMSQPDMERAITEAFSSVTVVATIEDIRKADKDYVNIEAQGTF